MDDKRWLSLNRLLDHISDQSSKSKDSIQLLAQLVLELELEFLSMKTGNLSTQEITNSYNRNEELEL